MENSIALSRHACPRISRCTQLASSLWLKTKCLCRALFTWDDISWAVRITFLVNNLRRPVVVVAVIGVGVARSSVQNASTARIQRVLGTLPAEAMGLLWTAANLLGATHMPRGRWT